MHFIVYSVGPFIFSPHNRYEPVFVNVNVPEAYLTYLLFISLLIFKLFCKKGWMGGRGTFIVKRAQESILVIDSARLESIPGHLKWLTNSGSRKWIPSTKTWWVWLHNTYLYMEPIGACTQCTSQENNQRRTKSLKHAHNLQVPRIF